MENTPATVDGGELAACPLARLRDVEQAGVHTHQNSGVKRSVSVSEYIYADYPLSPLQRFIQGLAGGYYNRYYMTELEDGSWLCVYFDDYLALTGTDIYPTVYVLDMYRHGKASWMIDVLLRLAVCLAVAGIVWSIKRPFQNTASPPGESEKIR